MSCARGRGVFHLLPRESCSPKVARLALLFFFFFFFHCAPPARQLATVHLLRDVMAAVRASRTSSLLDGTIRQGFLSCWIPIILAAMTSPCASQASLAFRGFPHASTCALPVRNLRRALCEQNALCRPHRALHTRPPGEPLQSKFVSQPTFCPSAGSAQIHHGVSRPDITCADAHVAASCEARHEPRARCCANPARSPKQLRPLLGLCPSSGAVVVAIPRTHFF